MRRLRLLALVSITVACGGRTAPAPALPPCGAGLARAGDRCVDPLTDPENCGSIGNACATGQPCSAGACAEPRASCPEGLTACGSGPDAPCVDLASDALHCGACGSACAAGWRCVGGACDLACPEPRLLCRSGAAAVCIDPLTDASHCGACGAQCPAGQGCSKSACALTCAPGLATCGTGASAACADLATDPRNCGTCGNACPAGQRCAAAVCELPCAPAQVACGTGAAAFCADLRSDPANCGACGHTCRPDAGCVDGRCVAACPEPRLACGGVCTDPRRDDANCGACGVTCPEGRACRDGFCAAPACAHGAWFPGAPAHPVFDLVALGDLNGDGRLDLVSGSWGSLGLALGNGDGTFGPVFASTRVSASSISAPRVLVVDLDGDGRTEVVASGCSENTVSIFHLQGGGMLGARVDYPVASCPAAAVAADLDGDGFPDLAVVTYNSKLAVLRNAGDGTLLAPVYYPVAASAQDLVVADLDGDGHADLATAGSNFGEVNVLWNDGTGGFEATATWKILGELQGIAAGDVDRDGAPDLVVADEKTGVIHVLRNQGGRHFAAVAGPPSTHQRIFALALADLDGDGWLDLLAPLWSGAALEVYRGRPEGFAAPERFAMGETGTGVAVGDLDGDRRLDVVVGGNAPGAVFLGRAERPVEIRGIGAIEAWTVADLDGDGIVDLVLADRARRLLVIQRGDGHGGFAVAAVMPVPLAATELLAVDLDADGWLDLALVNSDWGNSRDPGVVVLRNLGGLAFAAGAVDEVCDHPSDVVARDLDGDGRIDLAVACIDYWGPASAGVLLRTGDAFAVTKYTLGSDGGRLAAGDLDGDGAPDLVMNAGSGFKVLRNRGDGTFAAGAEVPSCADAWGVAVEDVDGDDVLDVVQACHASMSNERGFLTVSRGLGAGAFAPPVRVAAGAEPVTVTVRDVDGDGIPDLLATGRNEEVVTVVRGGGGGAFLPPVAYAVGPTARPAVADLDGDGRRDLAVLTAEGFDGVRRLLLLPQRCAP